MPYTVQPVFLARLVSHEKSILTYKKDGGVKVDCPMGVAVVRGGGKTILFDSGPISPELAPHRNHLKLKDHRSLPDGLAAIGLTPADIDLVVISHLHWDHSYNLELFLDKPIFVQGRDMEYAINPMPTDYVTCNVRLGNGIPQWLVAFESLVILDGEHHLGDGLDLIPLPGHSPGLQGLLVETSEGRCLLASDHYPMRENFDLGIPAGNHTDLRAWYDSHKKARRLADFIIPGHDEVAYARESYG